ncbi:alanine dehydrogenase [Motilimonas pumila]|uniref:Alanine dehydrogenase n=1 Tax=Motilimonas pumila TaxID=2303987 RepID=A0A418YGF1_9GAMM|nr:alanine dehydrogenase [Motilimonas pumila]RJG48726.1 alanine dehydrogenase [Motilimonas pumila]
MIIGVPKEVKNHEYRVGLIPASVLELIRLGHQVLVETQAGHGIDISDHQYEKAGAKIVPSSDYVFSKSDLIVKVKEPQPLERQKLKPHQILFTYLHLAADLHQAEDLIKSKAVCIAYETVTDAFNGLPLLAPMSEVAGRMSVQAGARALEKSAGGRGLLLAGVPGVAAAKVVIIGGGNVGRGALKIAHGMAANVTILDKNIKVLREIDQDYGNAVTTLYANNHNLQQAVLEADLVIGAVLVPGAAAPKLISADMVKQMKPGAVIVDVAIDQGGCCETARPTTHENPTYIIDNIVHYCVSNMPGAVARTATFALNNATLPYIIALAEKGLCQAMADDPGLFNGLNVINGHICRQEVADSLDLPYLAIKEPKNISNILKSS